MPSPFPGMNPYLEHPRVWQDFHDTYIPAVREVLNPQVVSAGYFVRIDENVTIRDAWAEGDEPAGKPDLVVPRVRAPGGGRTRAGSPASSPRSWLNYPGGSTRSGCRTWR